MVDQMLTRKMTLTLIFSTAVFSVQSTDNYVLKDSFETSRFVRINGYEGKCVLDNQTSLMWEVKQGGDGVVGNEGLHDADDEYNWYSTDNNGGFVGYENDDEAICYGYKVNKKETFCNTQAYVNRVNNNKWCNYTDWRLPTPEELQSIVDSSHHESPYVYRAYFPTTKDDFYWSSMTNNRSNYYAWGLSFEHANAETNDQNKGSTRYVQLVRSGQ